MEEEKKRPDPDALLRQVQLEETRKGRLKIFLGYAPGVGKTYTMLSEAHVLKSRGEDVVVGLAETHHRPETDAVLQDLEVIPRRRIEYKGIILEELDLDAILTLQPSIVIVDELAHTNPPNSRHPKRYQDIEELLTSGIDVYTAMNIQHFESINDVVAKITGVRVQETIPDTFLETADEVQLVDIPWEELTQRLREGKVYIPERAKQAMQNFFQRGNLFALRGLALSLVARKLDSELLEYMKARATSGSSGISERLLVCIAGSPYAKELIRKAYRIAKDCHAEWYAVYVAKTAVKEMSDKEKTYLTDALNLAEQLGAKTISLLGADIATEILRFARDNHITRIVIGKPLRSMLIGLLKGSPASRLVHARSEFELHLITPTTEKKDAEIKPPPPWPVFHGKYYILTLFMVIAATALNLLMQGFVNPVSLAFIYLIPTICSALLFGTGPSLFSSVVSLLTFDFFFTEPRYSLTMNKPYEAIHGTVFFFTSLVVGQLVKRTRTQNLALQFRLERVTLIEEMSKELLMLPPVEQLMGDLVCRANESAGILALLRTTVLDEISRVTIKYLGKVIDAPSYVLFQGREGRLQVWAKSGADADLNQNEIAVAEWAHSHGEQAGAGTETLSGIKLLFMPMKSQGETIGVIGMQVDYRTLLLEQRHLLGTISNLSSIAATRWAKV